MESTPPSDVTLEQWLEAACQRQRDAWENLEDVRVACEQGMLTEAHVLLAKREWIAASDAKAEIYVTFHEDPDERQKWEALRERLAEGARVVGAKLARELEAPPIRPVVVSLPVYRQRRPRPRPRGAGRPRGHTGRRRTCARSGDPDPDLAPELREIVARYAKQAGIPAERVLACAGCGVLAVCIDRYEADQLRALGWTAAWCPSCWKRMEARP